MAKSGEFESLQRLAIKQAKEIEELKDTVRKLANAKPGEDGTAGLAQRQQDAAYEKHWADFYAWKAEQQAIYDAIIESPGPVFPHKFNRPTPAPDPGPTADSIANELIARGLTDSEFEVEFARALKAHGLELR